MDYNYPKTPKKKKIPPDNSDPMQLATPAAIGQESQQKISEFLQNNSVNYQALQNLVIAVLQAEKDKDIQIAIQKQLEILEAILEFKNLGKREKLEAIRQKNSSRTTENKIISQLQNQLQKNQNQVENLEKSVENKFNLILKSIETKNQFQNQVQNQFPNQSSSQVKFYTQAVAKNSQAEEK